MLSAMSSIVPINIFVSVVMDFVTASRNPNNRSGRTSSDVAVACYASEERKACWRLIRCRSEPSLSVLRTPT